MEYGIMNIENGKLLSKTNLFTSIETDFLRTSKRHAEWLFQQFTKEKEYLVQIVDF